MQNKQIEQIKCCSCIHFPLCLAQKGGVNLQLASENNCCYYQTPPSKTTINEYEIMRLEEKHKERLRYEGKYAIKQFYLSFIDDLMRGCGDDKEFWVVQLINKKMKEFGFEGVE